MPVTSEDTTDFGRSAFEQLAKNAAAPDDRVLRALESEFAAQPAGKAPWWQKLRSGRLFSTTPLSKSARVFASLLFVALALILTSLGGLTSSEASAISMAMGGGLGLCLLFLPSAVPGPERAGFSSRQISVGAVLLLTLAYLAVTIGRFHPLASIAEDVSLSRIVGCTLHVLLAGGLCLVALLVPWRRSDPFSPTLLGALLGVLAGYSGMLSVDAACASTEGFHVLFGHASAVIVFGILGAAVGRRWLSP